MSEENLVSRRNVLCGIALLALGLAPDKAIAASGVKVLADGKVEIAISSNPALRKVGGVVQFQDGSGADIALVRTSKAANGFRAVNLSCTHEGVKVNLIGGKWKCPEHRAEFALNGSVKVGPAKTNLRTVPVQATRSKVVVG
ncbi:MAG: hypothetical protein RLZZ79_117 [Actinomycetota bacterium]|jgi:Rieske Fe-S protein